MNRWYRWLLVALSCLLGLYLGVVASAMKSPPMLRETRLVPDSTVRVRPQPAQSADSLPKSKADPMPDPAMRAAPPARMSPKVWPELPSEDLPVKSLVPVLKARADTGDVPAACRLAGELLRCRQQGWQVYDSGTRRLLQPELRQRCQGLGPGETDLLMPMLRQAALGGNLAAMEEYVSGFAFDLEPELAAPYLAQYRAEAPRLAASALKAGSVRMLLDLQNAHDYGGGMTWLARAMGTSNDPKLVAELQLLRILVTGTQGTGTGTLAERLAHMRQTQESALGANYGVSEALALQRFERWFGVRVRRIALGGLALTNVGHHNSPLNQRCGEVAVADPLAPVSPDWLRADSGAPVSP